MPFVTCPSGGCEAMKGIRLVNLVRTYDIRLSTLLRALASAPPSLTAVRSVALRDCGIAQNSDDTRVSRPIALGTY